MNVRLETEAGLCVARPDGRIDALSADELQAAIDAQLNGGIQQLVIDLEQVDYISSAGLRVFLRAAKRLPGKLAVCGLNANVQQIFDLAGFESVLKLCDTRDQACRAVTP